MDTYVVCKIYMLQGLKIILEKLEKYQFSLGSICLVHSYPKTIGIQILVIVIESNKKIGYR